MKYVVIIMLVSLMVMVCQEAFTDLLYLDNGIIRNGTLISQDDKKVVFRIGDKDYGVDVVYFSDEVVRIEQVGVEEKIVLPFSQVEGPDITMPRLYIRHRPPFANTTRPITDYEIPSFILNDTRVMNLDTEEQLPGEPSLLYDVEAHRLKQKEAQMQNNLRKYLR